MPSLNVTQSREEEHRVTVYLPNAEVTYQLKMKNSRTIFTEIKKKAGAFPFTLRVLEDEKRARMGITEAVQHGLLRPLEVVYVFSRLSMSVALIVLIGTRRRTLSLQRSTSP